MKNIEMIETFENVEDIENYIINIYLKSNEVYIPVIINEGIYTKNDGRDFYLKLLLAHTNLKIDTTWIKNNLEFGIKDPDDLIYEKKEINNLYKYLSENIIVDRKVKGKNLYQLNPNIISEYIEEYEYDNNDIINAYYNEEFSKLKGIPLLKYKNNNLYLVKNVLKYYLNEPKGNCFPKLKIIAEYEYRTHNKHMIIKENKKIITKNGYHEYEIHNDSMYVRGSISLKLDFGKRIIRNIKVLEIRTGKCKIHNPSNFNDDINAGLIIFKKDVIKLLSKDYYFYDMIMIDKSNIENEYLIDILEDKVVFWEGEYNKLPLRIKDNIDKYNYLPNKEEKIISDSMKAWQLMSDSKYYRYFNSEHLLAMEIRNLYYNKAIEKGFSILLPENISDFSNIIQKVEDITGIKLEKFNVTNDEVKILFKIRNNTINQVKDIEKLFRKYCLKIYRILCDENEK